MSHCRAFPLHPSRSADAAFSESRDIFNRIRAAASGPHLNLHCHNAESKVAGSNPYTRFRMRRLTVIALLLTATPLFAELDTRQEIIDWSVIAGAGAGAAWLNFTPPLTQKQVFSGQTDLSYHADTVPLGWVAAGCAASGIAVALIPNTDGRLNERTYIHVKGFAAAMSFNALTTEFAKFSVGRKRPSYENYPQEREGRRSFWSGHSSFSFAASTYLSLFVARNTGDDSAASVAAKIAVPLALFSSSAAVCVTRVRDHKHNVSDVVTGAAAGTLTSCAAFWWAEQRCGRLQPNAGVSFDENGRPVYGASVTYSF